MKRLLTYLLVVLGFGLTFSVKAKSEILKIRYNSALCPGCDTDVLRFNSTEDFEIWINKKTSKKTWMWTNTYPDFNWNNHEKEIGIKIITIDSSKDIDLYEKVYSNLRNWYFAEDFWNHKFFYQIEVSKLDEIINFKKSQIAKAEPSQTGKGLDLLKQQVEWKVWVKHVDKDYRNQKPYIGDSDYIIYDFEKSKYLINPKNPKEEAIFIAKEKCRKDNPFNPDGCLIDKINEGSNKTRKTSSYDRPTETKYYYEEELKNYLAKKQPSQTQKVAKVEEKYNDFNKYKFCDKSGTIQISDCWDDGQNSFSRFLEIYLTKRNKSESDVGRTNQDIFDREIIRLLKEFETYNLDPNKIYSEISRNTKLKKLLNNSNIKFTKAEPTQTQEQIKETNVKLAMTAKVYDDQYFDSGQHTTAFNFSHKAKLKLNDKKALNQLYKYVFNNTIDRCKLLNKTFTTGICTVTSIKFTDLNNPKNNKSIVNKKGFKKTALFFDILNSDNTKIAGAEPTITPKKKVKVAKVEDPKQEEFKPENKDIDNDAPVIEIAQNIIVSDTSYVIEGKVSDKSDKIFVEIDGQPIEVKKGKFKANRYSPVDEQIKIVAIDQWGNKSKPKLVNIKIKLDETAIAEKLEPLNPSNIKTKSSKNKIAIIIGIENYAEAPKANYANLDAQYFFDYARRAFGVKKQNINLLINEDATVVKTDKALSLWLKSKIKKNRSELIIFFAGHGLASTDGKELYLLPQDGNPDRLKRTALSRTDLFREIIELNPKSVTMFLDTCYSGVSRDEQMLLASARPLRIVADEQEEIPNNFTIFSASKLDQISSGLTEVNHGIFSYYLMKGLEGYADFNEDKKITNGELLAYMDENVSQKAAEQGREQNPSLAGDPNKVLVSFN